jgi:hypothetical protein
MYNNNLKIITQKYNLEYLIQSELLKNDQKYDSVFTIDPSNNRVGINNTNPQQDLDIPTIQVNSIVNPGILNVGPDSSLINIGTENGVNKVINIGQPGDIININGTISNITSSNGLFQEKFIVVNKGGAEDTGGEAGIKIEENNAIAGYILTDPSGNYFNLKAPNNNYILSTPILTQNDTFVLNSDSRLIDSRQCNNNFDDPEIARINLGLGTIAVQNFNDVNITGGNITNLTSLSTLGNVGIGKSTTSNALDISGNTNLSSGYSYLINNNSVLSNTTLGSSVINSSLTSVGTLNNLSVNNIIAAQGIDNSGNTLNIGNTATTINIGTGIIPTTINIGGDGDIVNIGGDVNYIHAVDLQIEDKAILLNKNAVGTGTARNAGIFIRDDNNDEDSYLKVSSTGTYFDFKAPENNFILSTPILTQNDTIVIDSQLGTIAIQDSHNVDISGGSITNINSGFSVSGNIGSNNAVTATINNINTGGRATLETSNNSQLFGFQTVGNTDIVEGLASSGVIYGNNLDKIVLVPNYNIQNSGSAPIIFRMGGYDPSLDKFIFTTSGQMGINMTNPNYNLDISGNANISNNYKINGFDVLSSTTLGSTVINSSLTSVGTLNNLTIAGDLVVDNNTFKIDTSNNRVGILNASPTYALDVSGYTNLTSGYSYKIGGNDVLTSTTLGSSVISSSLTSVGTLNNLDVSGITNLSTTNIYGDLTIDNDVLKVDTSNNKVGILNTSPIYALDVSGNTNLTTGYSYKINGVDVLTENSLGSNILSSNLTSVGTLNNLNISGDLIVDTDTFRIDTSNNRVGILNTSPTYALDVSGYTNLTNGYSYKIGGNDVLTSTTLGSSVLTSNLTSVGTLNNLDVSGVTNLATTNITGDLTIDNDVLKVDTSNNKVGILNTSPTYALDISGNTNLTTGYSYKINSNDVITENSLGSSVISSSLTSVGTLNNLNISGDLIVDTDTFRIDTSNNRIGILNTSPTYALDVSGNTNLTTGYSYKINGFDVLTENSLGSNILTSNLTSVGTLTNLNISGDLIVDTDTFRIDTSNNRVGILNTSPTYTLDVSGYTNLTSGYTYKIGGNDVLTENSLGSNILTSNLTSVGTLNNLDVSGITNLSTTNIYGDLTIDNDVLKVDTSNNKVGILNTSPTYTLDVSGNTNLTSGYTYKINGNDVLTENSLGSNILTSNLTSVGTLNSLDVSGITNLSTTNISGDLTIDNDVLKVDTSNNKVGILNTSPNYALDISGNTNLTSGYSYKINGTDVLNSISLGSGVISSSLTSVGTLNNLTISGDLIVDTDTFRIDTSNNRVGILNTSPTYTLDVSGNTNLTTGYTYKINGSDVLSSTSLGSGVTSSSLTSVGTLNNLTISGDLIVDTNTFRIDTSNNRVGILNTSPTYTLDVSGNTNLSSGYTYKINGTDVLSSTSLGSGVISSSLTSVGTLNSLDVSGITNLSTTNIFGDLTIDNNVLKVDTFNNRVGILNTSPTYALDVSGNTNLTSGYTYKIGGNDVLSSTTLGSSILTSSLTSVGTLNNLDVSGITNLSTTNISGDLTIDNDVLKVDTSNNRVGILNTSPTYTLDVSGNTNLSSGYTYKISGTDVLSSTSLGSGVISSSLTSVGTLNNLNIAGDLIVDTDTFRIDTSYNRVGILNTSPTYTLDVSGYTNLSSGYSYKINGNDVLNSTSLGTGITSSSLTSVGTLNNLNISGDLVVDTDTFKIDTSNNRVGILNTSPTYTLDVSGNTNLTSGYSYKINGNDVLTSTTLGSGVVNSSLTSVGTLSNLTISGDLIVDTDTFRIDTSNNRIGILNTSPTYALDVSGNTNLTSGYTYKINGSDVLSSTTLGSGVITSSLTSVGTLNNLDVSGITNLSTTNITGDLTIDNDVLKVDTSNNRVGILNTSPTYALDVSGNTNLTSGYTYKINGNDVLSATTLGTSVTTSSLTSVGTLNNLNISGDLIVDTDTFRIDTSNNRVGILNTSPTYTLDVSGNTNLTFGYTYKINGSDVLTSTSLGSSVISSSLTSLGTLNNLDVSGITNLSTTNISGDLTIDNDVLKVDTSNNRVGILNTSPTYALDVSGNTNITSGYSYKIGGNDVLSSTTLGSGVTTSSLTSVGTLNSLTISGDLIVDTDTFKIDTSNNRVGILNTSPTYALDVSGNTNLTSGYTYKINGFDVLSSTSLGSGVISSSLTSVGTLNNLTISGDLVVDTNTFRIDTSNNRVGILNTSPTYTLDVSGNTNLTSGYTYKINGSDVLSSTTLGSDVITSSLTSVGTLNNLDVSGITNLSTTNITGDLTIDNDVLKVDTSNNRVGILNTSPTYTLDVSGNTNLTSGYTYKINGNDVLSSNSLGSGVTSSSLTSVGTLNNLTISGDLVVDTDTFKIDTSNNKVGILNTSPTYVLDVSGHTNLTSGYAYKIDGNDVLTENSLGSNILSSSLTSVGTLNNLTISGDLIVDNDVLRVDTSNNRVGILNTSPNYALDVSGNTNLTAGYAYKIGGNDVLTATTLGSGVITSSLISVGTLTGLDVSGITNLLTTNVTGDLSTTTRIITGAGTSILPAITYTGDVNTGIYYPALDNIAFVTNANERLRINDVGNIGIGITNPSYKLDISGNANISSGFAYKIGGNDVITSTSLGSGVTFSSLTSVGTLNALTVNNTISAQGLDNSGNTLDIGSYANIINVGAGIVPTTINIGSAGDTVNIAGDLNYIQTTNLQVDDNEIIINKKAVGSGTARGAGILIRDNDNDSQGYMRVNNTGDGFNFKAPENNFILSTPNISSNSTVVVIDASNQILLPSGTVTNPVLSHTNDINTGIYFPTTDNIALVTDGLERLRIDNSGNIGINNTSPNYALDISGNANLTDNYSYKINGSDVLSATTLGSGVTSSSLTSVGTLTNLNISGDLSVDTNTLIVDSSNNYVGIGTTNPTETLDVMGTIKSTYIKDINNSVGSANQVLTATGSGYQWITQTQLPYNYSVNIEDMFPENEINITDISGLTGSAKWFGGVLARNGNIYCIPHSSTYVLIINPNNNTYDTTSITDLSGNNKWAGGVLAQNGKIYCIPNDSDVVLIIDTNNNTADTTTITGLGAGTNKWCGGVLASNGKIYGIPRDSSNVLIIDPVLNTADVSTITGLGAGTDKWLGGVLAPNGKIYCAPGSATTLLVINPLNNTADTTSITGLSNNSLKWSNGSISSNSTIYFMPLNATTVLSVDYTDNTINELLVDASGWFGSCTSPNGKIYGVPYINTSVLLVDSIENSINTNIISGLSNDINKWIGCVLAQNGKIYNIPYNSENVLIIKTGLQSVNNWILNPGFNKY